MEPLNLLPSVNPVRVLISNLYQLSWLVKECTKEHRTGSLTTPQGNYRHDQVVLLTCNYYSDRLDDTLSALQWKLTKYLSHHG